MLNDFEEINAILSTMADYGMVEPCDCDDAHPMDWAEVTGLVDELAEDIYPEPMVDDQGVMWYIH